jgi:hypothetical protein
VGGGWEMDKELVRRSECKRKCGRPKRRWENNIKIILKNNMKMWMGLIWLWTRANVELL